MYSNTGVDNSVVIEENNEQAIRTLRSSDVETLHALLIGTDVFNPEEIDIALELIQAVLDKADQKDYVIRVYEEGGEVDGYYCVGPTPATASTFDLYWIAVKPSSQGKGIGRKLMVHAEQLIQSMGGRLVVAETSSTPRYDKTRQFYLNTGYTELARIREYYRVGDDLVVYGKYLS